MKMLSSRIIAGKCHARRAVALTIGAMILASCGGDGGTEPLTGNVLLTVTLRAPEAPATGAVRLRMTGAGITGVQAAFPGYAVYSRTVSATEVQVIVVGTLASGPILTAEAVSTGGAYEAEVLEAATTADAAIDPPTGYNAVVATTPLSP